MAILVAYDGSENAKKAVERATALRKEGEEIVILYVIPEAEQEGFRTLPPEVPSSKGQEIVNEAIERLKGMSVPAIGVLRRGNVAGEIIAFASELKCSYVVIGSRSTGRGDVGSVAERVVKQSDRPVMIVR
ncbi:MAG: universal stress protein [Candidatus Thermoplasmatota archaeon]